MLTAMVALSALAAASGLLLGLAAVRFRTEGDPVVERIDALLPQTQCGQCGFAGCRPYAKAIASGEADINQCPPGGEATIQALANLLARDPKPLNPENGIEQPKRVAVIDEQSCIGCTLCIQACPVDAILGAPKQMHTVIEQECTGCKLCLAPCPVDCITMVTAPQTLNTWKRLIMGGPMMGFALDSDAVPLVKGSNCILAINEPEVIALSQPAMPCIRCGACAEVCPVKLLPQQLYWYAKAKDFAKTQDYHLFDCIECGCCAYVCPSHIPLVHYYRFAKAEIRAQQRQRQKADLARRRYAFRLERLKREHQEKSAKLHQKKAALNSQPPNAYEDPKKAAIAAALARVKAKKDASKSKATDLKD